MQAFKRPDNTNLGNWRTRPYNAWAFHNVRELIPTACIRKGEVATAVNNTQNDNSTPVVDADIINELEQLETDSIVVLKDGLKQWQWSASHCDNSKPHIIFSISKSITALMTGCLWGQNLLDVDKSVSHYLEKTKGSGYADCTLQQLLDMQVSINFTEDYTDPSGDYFRYRNATCWNPIDQTNDTSTLEPFLYGIQKGKEPHGESFAYKSPNTDLLGLLIEQTAGIPFAQLLSDLIWKPMRAESDSYVTVDQAGLARGAGGICVTIDDLARLGQLMLNQGAVGTQSIIPEAWIHDTLNNGNQQAWLNGGFTEILPSGNYRNKWYQTGNDDGCFCGIGIHGQWLFINPKANTVVVKYSSQAEPLDEKTDGKVLELLLKLSRGEY